VKVLVIEDERPAREQLRDALLAWDPTVEIVACIDSVADARRYLREQPTPDLIIADVRLSDGDSLEIFETVRPSCPLVFVTAFDRYALDALESGGIDYILKPIDRRRVAAALDKIVTLRRHFRAEPGPKAFRRRLLVKQRGETRAVDLDDVVGFETEERLVLASLRDGTRYTVDKTLSELTQEVDPARFFRINRSRIIAIEAVEGFASAGKGRLRVRLRWPVGDEGLVSAEHVDAFRRWLDR